jgi:hypothetical protein
MERVLTIAIFLLWFPLDAAATLAQRLGSTYGTCAREGELEMVRLSLPDEGVNFADVERAVFEFRNRLPQANDCQCPTISPTVLTDLETHLQSVLGIMLDNPSGFTPAETDRIISVISACEAREQRVFNDSLAISRGVYSGAVPPGFTLRKRFTHPSGLEGYLLSKAGTNPEELTIAFSGTEDGADVVADILFKGKNQHAAAVAMMMETMMGHMNQGKKVTCTGHSLGGGVAQGFCASLLARMQASDANFSKRQADNRLRVVTFGSLGGSSMVSNEANIRTTWFASNNTHFVVNGDVIPRFDPPTCGQIRSLSGAGNLNPVEAHDLGTFERLARNGWNSVKQGFRRIDEAAVNLFNSARQGLNNLWRALQNH